MIDISGRWAYAGTALDADGRVEYEWNAQVTITTDTTGVRVTLEAERSQSRSISCGATINETNDGRLALLYDYIADPEHAGTSSHNFFGLTRFVFDADSRRGEGHYFNYNGRYTFGRIVLTRV